MRGFFSKILVWLKDVIPTASVIAGWVYSFMLRKLRNEENLKEKAELEKELAKNALEVEKEHSGKSNASVILEVANGDVERSGSSESERNKS